MRVATSTMNTVMLAQTLRVQAQYTEALNQQSSSLKSDSLSGLSGQAGTMISLQSDLKVSEALVTRATTASSQVEVAYGAVGDMADLVTAAQTAITASLSGTVTDTSTLAAKASAWLTEIEDLLNTNVGGAYIFSGAGGQTKAVDFSNGTNTASLYYEGNGADGSLMVDGEASLSYGVRANNAAFEKLISALTTLSTMTTSPPDQDALQSAFDTLDDALTGLGKVQETLSDQSNSLESIIDSQTEFQLYAESALDSVRSVDVAEAAAKAAQVEVVLKASYAALASLNALSLTDYL